MYVASLSCFSPSNVTFRFSETKPLMPRNSWKRRKKSRTTQFRTQDLVQSQSLLKNYRFLIVRRLLSKQFYYLKLFLAESMLPGWHKFPLHPRIMMALHEKGFESPTAIQAASLPFSLADRDVVGVAQTVCLIAVSKFDFVEHKMVHRALERHWHMVCLSFTTSFPNHDLRHRKSAL